MEMLSSNLLKSSQYSVPSYASSSSSVSQDMSQIVFTQEQMAGMRAVEEECKAHLKDGSYISTLRHAYCKYGFNRHELASLASAISQIKKDTEDGHTNPIDLLNVLILALLSFLCPGFTEEILRDETRIPYIRARILYQENQEVLDSFIRNTWNVKRTNFYVSLIQNTFMQEDQINSPQAKIEEICWMDTLYRKRVANKKPSPSIVEPLHPIGNGPFGVPSEAGAVEQPASSTEHDLPMAIGEPQDQSMEESKKILPVPASFNISSRQTCAEESKNAEPGHVSQSPMDGPQLSSQLSTGGNTWCPLRGVHHFQAGNEPVREQTMICLEKKIPEDSLVKSNENEPKRVLTKAQLNTGFS